MATKMTYTSALESVLSTCELSAEVAEKLTALKASLEKKNSAKSGKPTAKQTANSAVKAEILSAMEPGCVYTVTEMVKSFPALDGLTNQKVSALVKQMVDSGDVIRSVVKGTAYFGVAEVEAE